MRKNILIIAFNDLKRNRRVSKQINLLRHKHNLTAVGFSAPYFETQLEFIAIRPTFKSMSLLGRLANAILMFFGAYRLVYDNIYDCNLAQRKLSNRSFDLVIIHDIKPMLFLERLGLDKDKCLVDAHEYFYDIGNTLLHKLLLARFDRFLVNNFFIHYQHYVTVSEEIASLYSQKLHKPFSVIRNMQDYQNLSASPVADKIRIIHHGYADRSRRLEEMIAILDHLDKRFELYFMLASLSLEDSYIAHLKGYCQKYSNLFFIQPAPPNEIMATIQQFDIGLYILRPTLLNFRYALPNKLFEFIQARLMVAIGPSLEMKKIVETYDLGIVSQDFEPKSLAEKLNALSVQQIMAYKMNSHKYARELSSEQEMTKFEKIVYPIMSARRR